MPYTHENIRDFIKHNYRHFNAAVIVDAAQGWVDFEKKGGKMFLTLAGAMSTAELGVSLAEMIRGGHIAAITCTGANLEEDVYNLVAHDHYERVPGYRSLTAEDEVKLYDKGFNRVTDTCIPEDQALRKIEKHMHDLWATAEKRASAASRTSSSMSCCSRGASRRSTRSIPSTAGSSPQRKRTCRSSCPVGKTRRRATSSRRM